MKINLFEKQFAQNKLSVTSIGKQINKLRHVRIQSSTVVVLCSQASFRRLNFSRSQDGRVKVNEYHAAREILEKTGNKIINN